MSFLIFQKPTESSSSKPASPETIASVIECRICCEQTTCVTFQPCGHSIVCVDCSKRVKKCLDCGTLVTNKLNPQGEVLSKSQHLVNAVQTFNNFLANYFILKPIFRFMPQRPKSKRWKKSSRVRFAWREIEKWLFFAGIQPAGFVQVCHLLFPKLLIKLF